MFNHTRVRYIPSRIIHHSITLIVLYLQMTMVKTQATVFQTSALIIEIFINATGEKNFIGHSIPSLTVFKIVRVQPDFYTFQQSSYQYVISTFRYSLISIVKIVVVENKTKRYTLDDKGRKFCSRTSPLLLSIPFD